MAPARAAHVTGTEARTLARELAARLGHGGGLGFLYVHESLAGEVQTLVDDLRQGTGVKHWVGSVAAAVLSAGREVYDEPSVAALVLPFKEADYRLIPTLTRPEDIGTFRAGVDEWRTDRGGRTAIVHGDWRNARIPELVANLPTELDGGFLAGGLSSGEASPLQIVDAPVEGGLSGVLLADSVGVQIGRTQGCMPAGPAHEITAGERNLITELDDRPALEVLLADLGAESVRDLARLSGGVFVAFPITGSDTGDYLVRNLLGVDPDQGVIAIGSTVHIGQQLFFARRDRESATADLRQMLGSLRARAGDRIAGGLYFSCMGRGRNQFGDDNAEMRLIAEAIGEVPIAGFYCNGEIAHDRLYGYTGVLALFPGD
ncbi:MAG: FIST C-terminal domain-containing protein [Chromatiales bacterium]|nr:FIST C-terminal domain-containing protein [Chromatiales bacterium]